MPLFRPRATTLLRLSVTAAVLLLISAAGAALQYYHSPYWSRVGLPPDQPIMFSHRHHAGELRIDCRFCHATVETSAYAGMPTTQTCLNCHSQLFANTAMLRPMIRSAVENQPLAWNRVTSLPEYVYFNHGIHLTVGVSCISCHGEVGQMALTAKAEPLDMRECLDCHRDPSPRLESRETLFAATTSNSRPPSAEGFRAVAHPSHLTDCSSCHR